MTLPLVLFAAAAVGGLVMAVFRLSGKPQPPLAIAVIHGLAAALGLVLLIAAASKSTGETSASVALGLLLLAALGGFALFSQHLRRLPLSIPLMLAHAGLAVAGFIALLVSVLGTP